MVQGEEIPFSHEVTTHTFFCFCYYHDPDTAPPPSPTSTSVRLPYPHPRRIRPNTHPRRATAHTQVGADPADEAETFCAANFPSAPTPDCVEAMLHNLQAGWTEALEKQQKAEMLSEYFGGAGNGGEGEGEEEAQMATGKGGRRRRGGLFRLPGSGGEL